MRDPHDPWQDELTAATPTPQLTPTETELRRTAIQACPHCDTDGYRLPTRLTVCDHRTQDPAQTAQRHIAAIRAQMGWASTSPHTSPKSAPECATAPATHPQTHPHTPPNNTNGTHTAETTTSTPT